MGNIQLYKQFIQNAKETNGKKILEIIWNTIIPGIRDILDDYRDNYDILFVQLIDEDSNRITEKESHWGDIDNYIINVYLEIGEGDATTNTKNDILKRILSEFGDDLSYSSSSYNDLDFRIK